MSNPARLARQTAKLLEQAYALIDRWEEEVAHKRRRIADLEEMMDAIAGGLCAPAQGDMNPAETELMAIKALAKSKRYDDHIPF